MAYLWCCGAEGCQAGTIAPTGHWNSKNGTCSTETSIVRLGTGSLKITAAAGVSNIAATYTAGGTALVIRGYFRYESVPASVNLCTFLTAAGGPITVALSGTSTVTLTAGTSVDSGIVPVAGVWYRLDVSMDIQANPWVTTWAINGKAQTPASNAVAASTHNSSGWRFGDTSSKTQTLYWDDMVVSDSLADYPIGDGFVVGYWPTSDGTHTATSTHIVKGTTATPVGTAITSATTDAYQWVDGPTIDDTADFWNQQTVAATEYAEVNFTDSIYGRPPHCITTLVSLSAAGTGALTQKAVLYDGTTATDMYVLGTIGVSHPTLIYSGKRWGAPPSGGAWTTTLFNALRARWGFSDDATPDAYVDNILIEADFPTTSFPNRPRHRNYIIR